MLLIFFFNTTRKFSMNFDSLLFDPLVVGTSWVVQNIFWKYLACGYEKVRHHCSRLYTKLETQHRNHNISFSHFINRNQ